MPWLHYISIQYRLRISHNLISFIEITSSYAHFLFVCRYTYFQDTARPAYSYIVFDKFSAIAELELAPFVYIPLLFYPSYNKLLL